MSFKLLDRDWKQIMSAALHEDHDELHIVCPFLKLNIIKWLLSNIENNAAIKIITRFNLVDFYEGVSDITALQLLLEKNAEIRGIRNLHAKLYIFGNSSVIVTSANLTNAAMTRNHEFGFESNDSTIISTCKDYFKKLWNNAGENLTINQLEIWDEKVQKAYSAGSLPAIPTTLGDEGININIPPAVQLLPPLFAEATQWFVKFFGTSKERANITMEVINELEASGSHWACTYPKGKRPQNVKDGAVMFLARMVNINNDIMIYGRSIGIRYRDMIDYATAEDIELRDWKAQWPHYIRVHHGQFIAGTLANGISLNQLKHELGPNAFKSTQRNLINKRGNINPDMAYLQQASVELTAEGAKWIQEHIETAFSQYGMIPAKEMEKLDWPETK